MNLQQLEMRRLVSLLRRVDRVDYPDLPEGVEAALDQLKQAKQELTDPQWQQMLEAAGLGAGEADE